MSSTLLNPSIITLGGGCFWCLEAVFERLQGVTASISGYANGWQPDPQYADVCTGATGHAEVVQLTFDPEGVSLRELLEVFFVIHDPTTFHRQGHDVGSQYRSGIYWHDAAQVDVAREVMQAVQSLHARPLVTELLPLTAFWPAEPSHQHYFARHPDQAYCASVIVPKLTKFRQTFARLQKDAAA